MSNRPRSTRFYQLRCRLGARLLREHLAESIRHYESAARRNGADGNLKESWNCQYICIGLRYAWVGPWRKRDKG